MSLRLSCHIVNMADSHRGRIVALCVWEQVAVVATHMSWTMPMNQGLMTHKSVTKVRQFKWRRRTRRSSPDRGIVCVICHRCDRVHQPTGAVESDRHCTGL